MKNASAVLILMFVFVVQGCSYRNEPRICDDGQMNHIIAKKFLTPYLNQKELIKEQFFIMHIGVRHDSLYIFICPMLQKSDSIGAFPVDYFSYGGKSIFIRKRLAHLLPIDEKSETILKFQEAIKSKPIFSSDYKKYPRWKITLKDRSYIIDPSFVIPQVRNEIEFRPPVILKEEMETQSDSVVRP